MDVSRHFKIRGRATRSAFSLVETLVATSITGVLFISLDTGFAMGFGMVQSSRENLRATHIMLEKLETIRLYSWDQINTPEFIPASFEAPFIACNEGSTCANGFMFQGTVTVTNAPIYESYSADVKIVTVTLDWNTEAIQHHREMTTFVANNGLQNYIY